MFGIQAVNALSNNIRILDSGKLGLRNRASGSSSHHERPAAKTPQPERLANWRFDPENPWPYLLSDLADVLVWLMVITFEDWIMLISIHYRQHVVHPKTDELPFLALGREIIRHSPQTVPFVIEWPGGHVVLRPSLRPLLLSLDTRSKRNSQVIQPWLDDMSVQAESPLSECPDSPSPDSDDSESDSDDDSVLLTPESSTGHNPLSRMSSYHYAAVAAAAATNTKPSEPIKPAFHQEDPDEDAQLWHDWVGLRP